MLKDYQINSDALIEWLIPFHLIEQYADYLNSTSNSRMDDIFICNCTKSRIGTNCEYESVSITTDASRFVKGQRPKTTISYETLTSFIDDLICNGNVAALEWRQICDGIIDCDDGNDELKCHLLELNRCEEDEFQCQNGMCIPKEFLFDIALDCMDSSDEQELIDNYDLFDSCIAETKYECDERLCAKDQFSCGNGQCIHWSSLILGGYACTNFRDIAYRCETDDYLVLNPKIYVGICRQTTMNLEILTNTTDCLSSLRHLLTADRNKSATKIRIMSLNNIIGRCDELIQYPYKVIFSPVLSMYYNRSQLALFYASGRNFDQQIPRKPHLYCLHGSMVCNDISINLIKKYCMTQDEFEKLAKFSFLPISQLFCQIAIEQLLIKNDTLLLSKLLNKENVLYYICQNTSVHIPLRRVNDGYIDCLYGDDERNGHHRMIEPYRYRCETVSSPNQYVTYRQLGNGVKNCADGSDEISKTVRWSSMKCDYHENYPCWIFQANGIDEDRISNVQLSYHRHCDTIWDTMDGQDEKNCSQWVCTRNAHRCNRTGQCINQTYLCDGDFDCDDGEDELNCVPTSRKWTFEQICNGNDEHFCISRDYLEDPISRRPCISYTKAGDGHVDCLGARDERNVFSCSDHLMLGDRFLCDNQTQCLHYTVVCDGIDHCLDRTDEIICHWNRSRCSPGHFGCADRNGCKPNRCDAIQRCSDKSHWFWCPISTEKDIIYRATKYHHVSNYETSCYQHASTRETNQVVKMSLTVFQTEEALEFPLHGYCNRGFYLTRNNQTVPLCFCPPSYYGNRCQYDSRRVTVRIWLDRRHRFDIPVVVTILVTLIYNHSEIIDHQLVFDINQDNIIKYNLYLLYPRPRPHGLYSVRFEAYHSMMFLAAWEYQISPFDFLPVFRLAKIVRFPSNALPLLCSINPCHNNGTCYLMNNNQQFCLCQRDWQGRLCEKSLLNVTCALNSLVRGRSICICPYGYLQPGCFVRNNICQQSQPCPSNAVCYPISLLPPHRFWCLCNEIMCNVRDALLTINRNKSDKLPYLFQLLKITSDYPRVRQQVLVYPSTTFPFSTRIKMNDPRNTKENLPEIGLLFTFEPLERSVDIILHLVYINCSTIFRNLSVDLDTRLHRCDPLQETELQSIKYLKNFCQKSIRDGCFLLKDYICYCNSSMIQQTECISYHQRQISCTYCYNQGYCVQGDLRNKSDFTCVCPKCVSGTLCQFSPSQFSISLEYLFEKAKWNMYHFIVPSLFFLFGMIFNGLCLLTFAQPKARRTGTGIYLLINSITSQLMFITLFTRIIFLHTIDQLILSENINRVLCKSLPYLMFSLNYISLWLMALVTVERAMTALFPTLFNSFGKPKSAAFLSVLLFIFVLASNYPHLNQYKLINHPSSLHPWCIRENESNGQSSIHYISLIHQISPFCINFIAALAIIVSISRSKAHIHHNRVRDTFKQQARKKKDLLIGPFVCFLTQLPQIIVLFLDICMYDEQMWFVHLTLITYYISFTPQLNLFSLYVLPSPLYKKLLWTETAIGKLIIPTTTHHTQT
ncbi:unnamed protein product [Rotaria magnacalcarata]|nr:unnamed protein product [Rotaria magnacalcarata]CAF4006473.1 unnamed protein product [Rotaria magnacalcarata]CAF4014542.1 unnamed protein product [Rotaria magnacalcarata]